MNTNKKNPRNYNCKDEELSTIGGYVLISLRRDRTQFAAYSPKYNDESILAFEDDVEAVDELVNPKIETATLKLITAELYAGMDAIFDKALRIEGYIKMSKGEVPLSAKDFGITALKQKVHAKDAVGTLQNARLVASNIAIYREPLSEQGLTTEIADAFSDDITSISDNNQKQYDIIVTRKAIVQANIDVLNALAEKIKDACIVGKILFRGNTEKLKEYTFSDLKKKAHMVHTSKKTAPNTATNSKPTK